MIKIDPQTTNSQSPISFTEARQKEVVENRQREAWLKYKGMDTFDAMQLYIDTVNKMAKIYKSRDDPAKGNE